MRRLLRTMTLSGFSLASPLLWTASDAYEHMQGQRTGGGERAIGFWPGTLGLRFTLRTRSRLSSWRRGRNGSGLHERLNNRLRAGGYAHPANLSAGHVGLLEQP